MYCSGTNIGVWTRICWSSPPSTSSLLQSTLVPTYYGLTKSARIKIKKTRQQKSLPCIQYHLCVQHRRKIFVSDNLYWQFVLKIFTDNLYPKLGSVTCTDNLYLYPKLGQLRRKIFLSNILYWQFVLTICTQNSHNTDAKYFSVTIYVFL